MSFNKEGRHWTDHVWPTAALFSTHHEPTLHGERGLGVGGPGGTFSEGNCSNKGEKSTSTDLQNLGQINKQLVTFLKPISIEGQSRRFDWTKPVFYYYYYYHDQLIRDTVITSRPVTFPLPVFEVLLFHVFQINSLMLSKQWEEEEEGGEKEEEENQSQVVDGVSEKFQRYPVLFHRSDQFLRPSVWAVNRTEKRQDKWKVIFFLKVIYIHI